MRLQEERHSYKNGESSFPLNTEWTGTLQPLARQYDKPCYLKFNKDKTVILYALFNFILNDDLVHKDTLRGTISKIETDGNDVKVSLDFPLIKESQTVTIRAKNTLITTSGGMDASKPNFFIMDLMLFPEKGFSVKKSVWSGKPTPIKGYENRHAYPDLSAINFGDKTTTYYRNGQLAMMYINGDPDHVINAGYYQDGPVVWMYGLNERTSTTISYFGVLQPSGQAMWADSRNSMEARLPNYSNPNDDGYGPVGHTPVIYKK